jgi:hypothetical protein
MSIAPILITFAGSTTADGNRFAGSLAETLRAVDPTIEVERVRERADTQDFGTSLAVVLGTAAVTELAKGFATWLSRNSGATIEIRREGHVIVTAGHLDSGDVSRLAETLRAAGFSNG